MMNEKLVNGVVKALDNKDTKALKNFFSEDVIENDADLDEQLENVINFYDDQSTSFTKTGGITDSIEGGTHKAAGYPAIRIITDKDDYMVWLKCRLVDTEAPTKTGIYKLVIVHRSIIDSLNYYELDWPDELSMGGGYDDYYKGGIGAFSYDTDYLSKYLEIPETNLDIPEELVGSWRTCNPIIAKKNVNPDPPKHLGDTIVLQKNMVKLNGEELTENPRNDYSTYKDMSMVMLDDYGLEKEDLPFEVGGAVGQTGVDIYNVTCICSGYDVGHHRENGTFIEVFSAKGKNYYCAMDVVYDTETESYKAKNEYIYELERID
jgi:hypothetical protein